MFLNDNDLVLFQGDSITDSGRPRDGSDWHLGLGYPQLVAALMGYRHPNLKLSFLNRGVGGDKVPDLQARWQGDCIELKPDCVSILVGINDASVAATEHNRNTAETYEAGYRDILTQLRDKTAARIIILQPFLLQTEHPYSFISPAAAIRRHLDPIIAASTRLAAEFHALYVPLDNIFRQASRHVDPTHWASDAIHPTPAGHALIAEAWIRAVEER